MKAKAQKAQIIRNSLGASVKAKVQKAQITRNRLGPATANQWSKTQKPQIIRNSLGASVKAKAQKAQITRNRLGLAVTNQWKQNSKPQIIRNGLQPSMNWAQKLKKLESFEIDSATWCKSMKAKTLKPQIIRNRLGQDMKAKAQTRASCCKSVTRYRWGPPPPNQKLQTIRNRI